MALGKVRLQTRHLLVRQPIQIAHAQSPWGDRIRSHLSHQWVLTLADAEATLAINVLGPIRLTNALVNHLTGQPDAAIVTVTSGLAYAPLVAAPTYSATKAAIHSYTVSLRTQLAGKVEVIELAPPGVQTDLTPGQANRPGYMPLDAVAAQFAQQATPREILVDEVQFLRQAEREGRFDETLTERAAKQREAGGQ
ncbi:SDR family NAD(P)-dependent oxidoreductase [uncultured Sphingomonas sp.]|uniref:SDR family NAD(P)-dependent oxidoreductase n=1 Tax=uncultured Sphingomonas sp. TaxID=158754 RepID=UPI0035C9AB39